MAAEDYEGTLKANLKRLSEIGAEVEEIGVSERIFEKLNEQELAIHKLTNQSRDYVTGREAKEGRKFLEDRIDKQGYMLEAKLRDQELAIAKLSELSRTYATREQVDEARASVGDARAAMDDKTAALEKGLKEDIKGLSEVDGEIIDDLSKLEGLFGRMDEQDLAIQKLRDLSNTFVGQKELMALREEILKEDIGALRDEANVGRATLERRVGAVEEELRSDIKDLTQVDAEVIQRLAKMEELHERVNTLGVELRKLLTVTDTFVDRKALDGFRESLRKEELDQLRVSAEQRSDRIARDLGAKFEELSEELKRLGDISKDFVFRPELRGLVDERLGALEKSFRDAVKTLSEVDGRIIDDLTRLDKIAERLRNQEVAVRKLSEMYEGFVVERDLREVQASLERRLERIPKDMEFRLQKLEEKMASAEYGAGRRSRAELEQEKTALFSGLMRLKEDMEKGTVTREAYEEAQAEQRRRLSRVEAQLDEMAGLQQLTDRVLELDASVKRLAEQARQK
ncbi:MAG: hypothetical protein HY558_00295 [Euryarchaeota archaeon]|nr:hypothetical protein [Euryarchaeota archaeon]